jgi:hypothetical protein
MGDFNNLPEANILSYPLIQIVHGATRKTKILDKIFTNVGEFYQQPAILPPIGSSDHNCVLLLSYNSDATNLADRYSCRIKMYVVTTLTEKSCWLMP